MSNKIHITDDIDHNIANNNNDDGLDNNKSTKQLKKYNNLNEFININKTDFGSKQETHMLWSGSSGSFNMKENNRLFKVEDDEYETFLDLYIKECKNKYGKMHIMEKPCEIGPLILDYDLKQTNPKRTLNSDDIVQVIEIINNIIMKYYDIEDENILESYIMMKNEPFFLKNKLQYSDGFHVHYPNLILSTEERFLIFDETKNEIIKQNLFTEIFDALYTTENFKNKLIEKNECDEDELSENDNVYKVLDEGEKEKIHDEVFDKSVIIKNKWFLYGSGKNIDGKINLYELKFVFDANVEIMDYYPNTEELIKLLSIRKRLKTNVIIKNKKIFNDKIEEINSKYINKNTKINFNQAIIKNDNVANNNIIKENLLQHTVVTQNKNKYEENEDNLIVAKKLVKLLKADRALNYNEWIIVGWALYHTSKLLLNEFIEFSKKSPTKYEEGCCERVWAQCIKRFNDNNESSKYTIASLYHWAKEDNPNGYRDFIKERINSYLDSGNIKTDYDVAYIIYSMYKYEYVCSSIKKNIWWQFEDHRWHIVEEATTLTRKFSEEVARKFIQLAKDYLDKSCIETGAQSDISRQKATNIMKLVENLKSRPFKLRLLGECSNLFYINKFEKNLDQNNYLVGFENGVYDLKTAQFRNGYPDDMISKSTGYNYKQFKETDNIIIDINKFFKSIQPEDDMRMYILCYCASLFEGSNKDQKFMIWTGSGSNGKGTLIELLDNILGDYFGSLPPTVLTQKRGNSSQATPELADKYGVRAIILQEPEDDDKINIGFMKNITGQDKIQARPLYGEPFNYVPQFKLLLACNRLPNIPGGGDGGVWRRVRVGPFIQKFVDTPNEPNEQPIDLGLRDKMKNWNAAGAWILLNKYYPLYCEHGISKIEPERVKLSTNKYQKDSNVYIEFMNDSIIFDEKSSEDKNTVWEIFKSWYTSAYEIKAPPQKKLFEFLEQNKCIVKGSLIKGIKIKEQSDSGNFNPIDY